MFLGGCYLHPFRYFSFPEAKRLFVVISVGWILSFMVYLWRIDRVTSFLLIPLGWFALIGMLSLPRIWARMEWEMIRASNPEGRGQVHLLIYGAGKRGGSLANWVRYGTKGLKLVGFIDDSPALRGQRVFGYAIYGRESDIGTIAAVHQISEIWTTFIPDPRKRARLQLACEKANIKLVIIPELEPFSRFALPATAKIHETELKDLSDLDTFRF